MIARLNIDIQLNNMEMEAIIESSNDAQTKKATHYHDISYV